MPQIQLEDPDDEERLLGHLRRFRARTGHKITVVFDSGGGYRPGSTRKRGGITVQFVSPGKSADQVIRRRLRRVKNPQGVTVVTSDRAIQQAARRASVRVLAADAFAQQLTPAQSAGTLAAADPGSQADVKLSPDEVDEWLDLFNR